MEKAEPSQDSKINESSKDVSKETESLLTQLLSMGFDEELCKEAVKFTNDQEKAIELIFQFQEDRAKGSFPQETQLENDSQEDDSDSDDDSDDSEEYESYKMVFLVRTDLGMTGGEIATQVGHAVLGAYKAIIKSSNTQWKEDLFEWDETGTAKIVLSVKSKAELTDLFTKARDLGLNTFLVSDSEIDMENYTVCAIGPSKCSVIDKITGHLRLMR